MVLLQLVITTIINSNAIVKTQIFERVPSLLCADPSPFGEPPYYPRQLTYFLNGPCIIFTVCPKKSSKETLE